MTSELRDRPTLGTMEVMPSPVAYSERASAIAGVTVWTRVTESSSSWILPDGCIDVLWNGHELTIAGPDTIAHGSEAPVGTRFTALRFASGVARRCLASPRTRCAINAPTSTP